MPQDNIKILNEFQIENIPDLDIAVLGALELLGQIALPKIKFDTYKRPLVVGSGNAEATGKIIFRDLDAIFASENNYEEKLKNIRDIDGVIIISASGEKHAPIIARVSKQYNKKVTLITTAPNTSASRELDYKEGDKEYIFPKNREPYTYNTSTYLGMILAYTKESPKEIFGFIQKNIETLDFSRLSKYDKFFLIVPTKFYGITSMLEVKFIELFGREIARDVKTLESVSHATTVVPSGELFISFGFDNQVWGNPNDRINIPLPDNANYGAMMTLGYYVIAQIQKRHPPYFKNNIVEYVKQSSKVFGYEIKAIVD